MAAFWAGTLPALIIVGAGVRRILGPIGRRLPALTCIALVGSGLYTLAGRAFIDPMALAKRIHPASASVSVPNPGDASCCDPHDARH